MPGESSGRRAAAPARGVGQDARHRLLVGLGRLLAVDGGDVPGRAGRAACGRCSVRRLALPHCLLAVRWLADGVVELAVGQAVADHLEGQEVLPLLAQHPAQPLDVVVEELAVARGRALGVDQALALEEADLRDGDVGELLTQQRRTSPMER